MATSSACPHQPAWTAVVANASLIGRGLLIQFRHQLPAYSPVSARASFLAAVQVLHLGDDPRPALSAVLAREYSADSVLLCGAGTQALTIAIREMRKRAPKNTTVALP